MLHPDSIERLTRLAYTVESVTIDPRLGPQGVAIRLVNGKVAFRRNPMEPMYWANAFRPLDATEAELVGRGIERLRAEAAAEFDQQGPIDHEALTRAIMAVQSGPRPTSKQIPLGSATLRLTNQNGQFEVYLDRDGESDLIMSGLSGAATDVLRDRIVREIQQSHLARLAQRDPDASGFTEPARSMPILPGTPSKGPRWFATHCRNCGQEFDEVRSPYLPGLCRNCRFSSV